MRPAINIVLCLLIVLNGYTQGNHVFSGTEASNFSIIDIPAAGITTTWSTDRAALPGYFSVVNTAAYTGCSDAAHINGYIKKYGADAFIFPVGNGGDLRTLAISSPDSSTDTYATAWIIGDPSGNLDPTAPNAGNHSIFSVTAPIISVSPVGQWDWQVGQAGNLGSGTTGAGTTGSGAGLTITVSIPDMTSFAATSKLRLVGWNGTSWIDLSGIATASGNTENSTLIGMMVPGITAIAIGSVSMPLALTLQQFSAVSNNCNALLKWKTSQEVNLDKFDIEQSTDNINFVTVATVKAKNNNTGGDYSIELSQPSGLSYYRLKMTDKDGSFTYSNITICRTNCSFKEYMRVYPNPVVDIGTVNVNFGTPYKGRALLYITNTLGQRFMNLPLQVNAGDNIVPIEVARFASGTYFVTIIAETGDQIGTVQKFIKQ